MTYIPGSEEPPADVRAFAATCREMFTALVNEEFTERQALDLVGHMLAAGVAANVNKGD